MLEKFLKSFYYYINIPIIIFLFSYLALPYAAKNLLLSINLSIISLGFYLFLRDFKYSITKLGVLIIFGGSIIFLLQYIQVISVIYIFSPQFITFLKLLSIPILNIIAIVLTKILQYKQAKITQNRAELIYTAFKQKMKKPPPFNPLLKIEYIFLIITINIFFFYAGISFWYQNIFPTLTFNVISSTFILLPAIWHKSLEFKYFLINSLLNIAFFILLIWRIEEFFNQLILTITFSILIELFISIIFTYLTFFKIVPLGFCF